jgi:hypothetical protein
MCDLMSIFWLSCLCWGSHRLPDEPMDVLPTSLDTFTKMQKAGISFAMSVHLSTQNNSAPTGQILMKLDIWNFFENLSRKFKFYSNLTRITGTFHEDVSTFMRLSHWILLRMRNVSNKSCRENQITHFMHNNFVWKSCHLRDNVKKCGGARGHRLHARLVRSWLHGNQNWHNTTVWTDCR